LPIDIRFDVELHSSAVAAIKMPASLMSIHVVVFRIFASRTATNAWLIRQAKKTANFHCSGAALRASARSLLGFEPPPVGRLAGWMRPAVVGGRRNARASKNLSMKSESRNDNRR
jgi:hypothetical protein